MSKKVIFINGSGRNNGNTSKMLNKIKEGAISKGADVELINLFDLNYKGCNGCHSCKLINGKSYGHCSVNDDLKPVFQRIEMADVIILGSPIYWSNLSGQMRSFIERLFFQYLVYDDPYSSLAPKSYKTALVTTMNINDSLYEPSGVAATIGHIQMVMQMLFGHCEVLNLYETVQFDDYSKYIYRLGDKEEKSKRNPKIREQDMEKAFDLGARIVGNSVEI